MSIFYNLRAVKRIFNPLFFNDRLINYEQFKIYINYTLSLLPRPPKSKLATEAQWQYNVHFSNYLRIRQDQSYSTIRLNEITANNINFNSKLILLPLPILAFYIFYNNHPACNWGFYKCILRTVCTESTSFPNQR